MDLDAPGVLRVFPRVWLSGVMQPEEVGEYCGDYEPAASATYAAMGFGWPAPKLERLIVESTATRARRESWKVPRGSWRMILYRATDSSDSSPIGMLVFHPVFSMSTRTKRLARFWLTVDLLWVHPTMRGMGYGKHLVAHMLRYLEARDATASGHEVGRAGLEVVVNAEIHHPAADHLVRLVYEWFELQREMKASGEIGSTTAWRVSSAAFIDE